MLADNILHLDIEDTVDKFDLRQHVITSVECLGGAWNEDEKEWTVKFRDVETGLEFERHATVFVSAVGAISFPRDVRFKGMENFKGDMFHTARWDHSVDYTGKRVVSNLILSDSIHYRSNLFLGSDWKRLQCRPSRACCFRESSFRAAIRSQCTMVSPACKSILILVLCLVPYLS